MVADKLASYTNANFTAKESLQKTRQVVLLYDGVLRFLEQAKTAMSEKNFEERYNLLQKASNVIVGLHSALDFEKGGELSKTLSSFYSDMDRRVIALNISNDIAECDAIINEIKLMREAWDKVDQEYGDAPNAMKRVNAEESKDDVSSKDGADFNA